MLRILLLALLATTAVAESLEQRVAKTDMSNAESVFELGQWCAENKLPTKARQYYNAVIKLEKDHEGARTALGQVKVGERWVSAGNAGPAKPASDGAAGAGVSRSASGTPPTAAQVEWNLALPKDPQPANTFINSYIERMSSVANDSRDMDVSVATLVMPDHLPNSIPRLCAALMRPDFRDLYGASMVASDLARKEPALAKQLLPFLVKASERVTDPGDLDTFAFTVGMFKDRKVVPRLIELYETGDEAVRGSARSGLSMVTLLPEDSLTVDKAKSWWALNHNVSDQQIYSEQLRSSDEKVAVEAAKALYAFRDKSIVPVLVKLLKSGDRAVCTEAIEVIRWITNLTWSYDPNGTPEEKKKRAEEIERWWKEEQFKFVWMEDRNAKPASTEGAAKLDPATEWVRLLASTVGAEADTARANLISTGDAAVPALLAGLADPNTLVQRQSYDVLLTVSKLDKAKMPFDPRASAEDKAAAIAAWTTWAEGKGLLGAEASGEDDADEVSKPQAK